MDLPLPQPLCPAVTDRRPRYGGGPPMGFGNVRGRGASVVRSGVRVGGRTASASAAGLVNGAFFGGAFFDGVSMVAEGGVAGGAFFAGGFLGSGSIDFALGAFLAGGALKGGSSESRARTRTQSESPVPFASSDLTHSVPAGASGRFSAGPLQQ